MIVISRSLILTRIAEYSADNAVFGWHNLVTVSTVSATTEDDNNPASNLANVDTSLVWLGTGAVGGTTYLTVNTSGYLEEIDYLAVARHNFGTSQQILSVEVQLTEGGAWTEVVTPRRMANDDAILFNFASNSYYAVRLKITDGVDVPTAAVLYVGKLLVMPIGIYVGYTPLKYATKLETINSRAITGDMIGRLVMGEYTESPARFELLDPDWFREYMTDFLESAKESPFFFSWQPFTYPEESGFAALINDPTPAAQPPANLYAIDLLMRGIP